MQNCSKERWCFFGNEREDSFLDSIIQSPSGWIVGEGVKGGRKGVIIPGIQLIKFSFFELLSANFTRFASVHFRVPAPWIHGKANLGWSEKFPKFSRVEVIARQMINAITSRVEFGLKWWNESTRIDNLAIENAINPRLNLISERKKKRANPGKPCLNGWDIYEYKLKNIFAVSSS